MLHANMGKRGSVNPILKNVPTKLTKKRTFMFATYNLQLNVRQ